MVVPGATALHAQPDLAPYLVQAACVDPSGRVIAGRAPTDQDCGRRRPLAAGEPLPYRKHDWPSVQAAARQPRGWQASDSLRGALLGRPAVLQVFDFGDDPTRAFGRFDEGKGDGGQAILTAPDGTIAAAMTEDGAGGVQWFASPACATSRGTPTAGWLFAAPPVGPEWQSRIAELLIVPRPDACPPRFVPSLTRWRLVRLELPLREAATGTTTAVPVDALVSEHYGRATIPTAEHLERFLFVRDLGLTRWERWEDRATSRLPGLDDRATQLTAQRRCPPLAVSTPPADSWAMVDCRTWTNLVRATGPGSMLTAPAWPAAAR